MMNNTPISFYIENFLNHLHINEVLLELSALHSASDSTKNVIIASIIGSVVVGSYFKSALYSYMYKNGKDIFNQPINLLILIKALIDHSICILMVTFYTTGLILDMNLADVLGEAWCNVPWYSATFAATYRTYGALGISILRLFYIKCPYHLRDSKNRVIFLYTVLTISIIVSAFATVGFGFGNEDFSRKQVNWNFCVGKSEEFREVLHNYSLLRETTAIESDFMAKLVVVIGMLGVMAEFVCYILFFKHLYTHDEDMLKSKRLPANVINQRHRTNAVTFLGQFYEFVAKCVRLTLLMYTMSEKSGATYRLVMVISIWVEFGIVSIVEVMTSTMLIQNLPSIFA